MKYIEKQINNIPIYINKTKMMKNIVFHFYFISSLDNSEITALSLLKNLLVVTTKKLNSKTKLRNYLGLNYSLCLALSFLKFYNAKLFVLTIDVINGKYIDDNQVLNNAIELMKEVILNPDVENEQFKEKYFEEVVYNLKNYLNSSKNNKQNYAYSQLMKEMFKGNTLSYNSTGTIDALKTVTSKDVYNCYIDLINNSMKSLYISGDIDESIINKLSFIKSLTSQQQNLELYLKEPLGEITEREIFEKMDIEQAILQIGVRYDLELNQETLLKLVVFSSMFGELQSSTLFQVVREENSLCYSIDSSLNTLGKALIINVGIDKDDYQKTVELIKLALKDYQDGKIDENLLNIAIENEISNLDMINDNPSSYDSYHCNAKLFGLIDDIEIKKQMLHKITIEDIKEISQTMKIEIIYLLSK